MHQLRYTNMKRFTILIILNILAVITFSQNLSKTDSLEKVLTSVTSPSEKVFVYQQLAVIYRENNRIDKAFEYVDMMDKLAKDIKDKTLIIKTLYLKGTCFAKAGNDRKSIDIFLQTLRLAEKEKITQENSNTLLGLGIAYKNLNQYDSAQFFLKKAENECSVSGMKRELAVTYMHLGSIDAKLNNLKKAADYYQKALDIRSNLGLDYERAQSLNSLGTVYKNMKNYGKAIELFNAAIDITQNIDDQEFKATLLNNIGGVYYHKTDYRNALEYYLQSLEIRQKSGNELSIAASYNNIGLIYKDINHADKAMEYFKKALEIYRKDDNQQLIANSLNYMGSVCWKNQDYDQALEYYSECLKIREKSNDKVLIASSLNNLAMIYKNLNQTEKSASTYMKALSLYETLKDNVNIAAINNNLGNLFLKSGAHQKALAYFEKAYQLRKNIGDKYGLAASAKDIAETYSALGQIKKAHPFIIEANELAIEVNDADLKIATLLQLSGYYEASGKTADALNCYKKFMNEKNKLLNEESIRKIAEMQVRYEAVQMEREIGFLNRDKQLKELEIARNQESIKRQRITIYGAILFLAVTALFSLILLKQNRKIKKAFKLLEIKNAEISRQKDEIEVQKTEIQKQRDIATAQRDKIAWQKQRITDSIEYASKIQNAVLPPDESIRNILPNHFIYFRPRDIVSGDFYWITQLGNKKIVAVADCTGHGVPGAFMSMLGVAFLNEIINRNELTEANEILDHLRDNVIKSLHQDNENTKAHDGMDMALCIIENDMLQFAGANNSIYLVRNGQLAEIQADKFPVGVHTTEYEKFTNNTIKLQHNDMLYLYTDGYSDQFGGADSRKLLTKNFKKVLLDIHQKSCEEQREKLDEYFNLWKGNNKQVDDILVLGIKILL